MKTSDAPDSIDDYIARAAPESRARLTELRALVRRLAPDAVECVKYQLPTFTLAAQSGRKSRSVNLVHFGAFQHHIGLYPTPSGIAAFSEELSAYQSAKGSVQFPLAAPLPLDLIGRIIEFRVAEVRGDIGQTHPIGESEASAAPAKRASRRTSLATNKAAQAAAKRPTPAVATTKKR